MHPKEETLWYTEEKPRIGGSIPMKKIGLLEVLEGIEDSRRERSVWYPLHEVLFIFIAAVICGATSYVKVEMFGKRKEKG